MAGRSSTFGPAYPIALTRFRPRLRRPKTVGTEVIKIYTVQVDLCVFSGQIFLALSYC